MKPNITKIRQTIYQLAVEGKLVDQQSSDQSAEKLFEEIQALKLKKLQSKGKKSSKLLAAIDDAEVPYQIPDSWKWTRLGDVTGYADLTKVEPSEVTSNEWVLELEDIEAQKSNILKRLNASVRKPKSSKNRFEKGDVLYGKLRPYLNKVVIADDWGICSTEIIPIKPYLIDSTYLFCFLKNPNFINRVSELTKGVNLPRLTTTDAVLELFPLPPLQEQKRIVEKVNELIKICDLLEAKTDLFAISVEKLRETIIQLSIQGGLNTGNEEDEPVDNLLAKIDEAKKEMFERGLIRKTKTLSDASDDQSLFEIPSNWEWVRLGNLGELNPRNPINDDTLEISFAPMEAIPESFNGLAEYQTRQWGEVKTGYSNFMNGDVLLAKVTPCFENGKSCIARGLKNGYGAGTTELHVFRGPNNYVSPEYIYYVLNSSTFRNIAEQSMTGVAGLRRVPKDLVDKYQIPLPPQEEQLRIVEKVTQLMTFCDSLELALSSAIRVPVLTEKKRVNVPFNIQQAIAALLNSGFQKGEMAIAKMLYLIQEVYKVDIGIKFTAQNFGPYDSIVKKAITAGVTKNNQFFKRQGSSERQYYSLDEKGSTILKYQTAQDVEAVLDDLMGKIGNAGSRDIERLATVCKIIQDKGSTNSEDVKQAMHDWKDDKFSDVEIDKSLKFIKEQKWDKQLTV